MIGTSLSKLFLGVGINDADYVVQIKETVGYVDEKQKRKIIWTCPFYQKWASMLSRCYSPRVQKLQPSYGGVTVCEGWLTFSNFKSWMEKQDWEGKELDKDLLVPGNLVYSPDTCVFIEKRINLFLSKGSMLNGTTVGISFNNRSGKYRAQCSNPFTGKNEYLGSFDNPEDACLAYMRKKYEFAKLLAELQSDERVSLAILSRYKSSLTNATLCERIALPNK